MFALATQRPPQSIPELLAALEQGATSAGLTPHVFSATGDWPNLETLAADFSGATLSPRFRFPRAAKAGNNGFFARSFSVSANPIRFEDTAFILNLGGNDAVFEFGTTTEGQAVVAIKQCSEGSVEVNIPLAAIKTRLHQLASEMAGKQGVDVQSTAVQITAETPQTLSAAVTVTAKALFMTAKVIATASVSIDDSLNAHFNNMKCRGDGMAGNMAAGFLRPYFEKLQAQPIALAKFLPANLQLSRPEVHVSENLAFRAKFNVQ